jgi:hypothetical protein
VKIKQHVVITDPDQFLRGDFQTCFTLYSTPTQIGNWIDCGEVELDINVDHDQVTAKVLEVLDAEIDKERAEHELKMNMLITRKNELLAITHEVAA